MIAPPIRLAGNVSPLDLGPVLTSARKLIRAVEQFAIVLDSLSPTFVDLPPDVVDQEDQARLQSAATLYLASELEAAGLVPAVESLAELAATGRLQANLGSAAAPLIDFWKNRHSRFSASERQAFYSQLFGRLTTSPFASEQGANGEFELLMIDLTDAIGQAGTGQAAEFAIPSAARMLTDNLLPRSGGIALAAAADLLNTLEAALAVLKHPAIQKSLGATGVWGVVKNVIRRFHGASVDSPTHLARGKAGMTVLAWLASYSQLANPRSVVADDPVVAAAVEWLQTSLTLHEADVPASNRRG